MNGCEWIYKLRKCFFRRQILQFQDAELYKHNMKSDGDLSARNPERLNSSWPQWSGKIKNTFTKIWNLPWDRNLGTDTESLAAAMTSMG